VPTTKTILLSRLKGKCGKDKTESTAAPATVYSNAESPTPALDGNIKNEKRRAFL